MLPSNHLERLLWRAYHIKRMKDVEAPKVITDKEKEFFEDTVKKTIQMLLVIGLLFKERSIREEKRIIPCFSCKHRHTEINEETCETTVEECLKGHDFSEPRRLELSTQGCVDFESGGIIPVDYAPENIKKIEKDFSEKNIADMIKLIGKEFIKADKYLERIRRESKSA